MKPENRPSVQSVRDRNGEPDDLYDSMSQMHADIDTVRILVEMVEDLAIYGEHRPHVTRGQQEQMCVLFRTVLENVKRIDDAIVDLIPRIHPRRVDDIGQAAKSISHGEVRS